MVEGSDKELIPGSVPVKDEDDPEIDKIKDGIENVRSQMGATIDAIQERLSVPAITENIKNEVSEQVSAAYQTTKTAVYETTLDGIRMIMKNASKLASASGGVLPLLLIGTGTGLLLMNWRKDGTNKSRRREIGSGTTGKGNGKSGSGSLTQGGESALDSVTGAATTAYHKVEDVLSSTASKVADVASTGKDKYVNYFDSNPMAVGAVAAAMGLAVGLALPLTETENELLGETAGSLRDRIKDAAAGTVETIKDSASEMLDNIEQGASDPPAAGQSSSKAAGDKTA